MYRLKSPVPIPHSLRIDTHMPETIKVVSEVKSYHERLLALFPISPNKCIIFSLSLKAGERHSYSRKCEWI